MPCNLYNDWRTKIWKNQKICPKCQSLDIINLDNTSLHSQYTSIKTGLMTVADIEVYVCGDCGYFEQYIRNTSDLEKIKKSHTK